MKDGRHLHGYEYITYDDYLDWDRASGLTDEDFNRLVGPCSRVIDAMLFHAVSNGRVDESKPVAWEIVKRATCMQMEYASQMGADVFLASDGRPVASESGGLGSVSDAVTYSTGTTDSMGLIGGHPASREAWAYLSSSGLVGCLRRVR